MSASQLLMAFAVGTALLALWSFVRWPDIAPTTMKAAFFRLVVALVLLQIGATVLGVGVDLAPTLGPLLVVAAVVPVLTYAFLASIWFMKLCADQMRGAV
jgi:ABC-type transporter Mla maintaining outer membrane lipid asymmetry permease subunit MlaE